MNHYSNADYDAAFAAAQASTDDQERTALYKQCLQILSDTAANVYLQDLQTLSPSVRSWRASSSIPSTSWTCPPFTTSKPSREAGNMKYAAKKLSALIITLFMVSVLAFLAFQIIPGDPTTKMLGTEATPEQSGSCVPSWVWIVRFSCAMGVGWPASCPETWAPATAIKCLWQT